MSDSQNWQDKLGPGVRAISADPFQTKLIPSPTSLGTTAPTSSHTPTPDDDDPFQTQLIPPSARGEQA